MQLYILDHQGLRYPHCVVFALDFDAMIAEVKMNSCTYSIFLRFPMTTFRKRQDNQRLSIAFIQVSLASILRLRLMGFFSLCR